MGVLLGRPLVILLAGCVLAACSGSDGSAADARAIYGPDTGSHSGTARPGPAPSHASGASKTAASSASNSSTSGGGSSSTPRTSGTTHPATSTAPRATHTSTATTPPPPSCTPPTSSTPAVVVCPHTRLHDGQTVTVYASGFPKATSVVVIECADKGAATRQVDCNKINFTKTSTTGTLVFRLPVYIQVSSIDRCSATLRCLVSVTQPSLTHSYEADQHITFA
jgi:hypothetical protein